MGEAGIEAQQRRAELTAISMRATEGMLASKVLPDIPADPQYLYDHHFEVDATGHLVLVLQPLAFPPVIHTTVRVKAT